MNEEDEGSINDDYEEAKFRAETLAAQEARLQVHARRRVSYQTSDGRKLFRAVFVNDREATCMALDADAECFESGLPLMPAEEVHTRHHGRAVVGRCLGSTGSLELVEALFDERTHPVGLVFTTPESLSRLPGDSPAAEALLFDDRQIQVIERTHVEDNVSWRRPLV